MLADIAVYSTCSVRYDLVVKLYFTDLLMRPILILLLSFILGSILLSCKKQTDPPQYPPVDVSMLKNTLTGRDTMLANLTIESGHRVLPEITMAPKHAKNTRFERQAGTGWLLYWYQAADGFKGVDSVEFHSIEPWMKWDLTTRLIITVR